MENDHVRSPYALEKYEKYTWPFSHENFIFHSFSVYCFANEILFSFLLFSESLESS